MAFSVVDCRHLERLYCDAARGRLAGSRAVGSLGAEAPCVLSCFEQLTQFVQNRFVVRELTSLVFAVNQVAVGFHVEDAAAALDEFHVDSMFVFNCFCQPGSLGKVVSLNAVLDRDVHWYAPFEKNFGPT